MTQYELDIQVRIEAKVDQMAKINDHAIGMFMNNEPVDKILVWAAMFDDLEAEVEVLLLLRETLFN